MNRSKLYEWLLDNDCPWEWDPINNKDVNSVTLVFTEKEEDLPSQDRL